MEALQELQAFIDEGTYLVFFGGAGVSKESGIPDFRSPDGLYSQTYSAAPEGILSRSFFDTDPETFYRFYREKMLYLDAEPNPAHRKLAELERAGKLRAVVTQNIDGLHQKAESRCVLELHGSVHRNRCMRCGAEFPAAFIQFSAGVPRCSCGGIVKPDVVLYEEPLDEAVVEQAVRHIRAADTLLVAGTSLSVWPAAGLLRYFSGPRLAVINLEETPADREAALVLHAPVGETFACLHA